VPRQTKGRLYCGALAMSKIMPAVKQFASAVAITGVK
jgi:hypothetical protein